MRSRTFLNVSLSILALALAYHLGTVNATAQTSSVIGVGGSGVGFPALWVLTSSGDTYYRRFDVNNNTWLDPMPIDLGNFWAGPTPTGAQESFGSLKARYRGEREPQGVKQPTNR